jgi:hypothetical protein
MTISTLSPKPIPPSPHVSLDSRQGAPEAEGKARPGGLGKAPGHPSIIVDDCPAINHDIEPQPITDPIHP